MIHMRVTRCGYIAVLLMLVLSGSAVSQNAVPDFFVGRWWLGFLEEASLPINIKFEAEGPVLFSPMQSDEAMPASVWSYKNDTLRLSHKGTGLKMTLAWNAADSSFAGSFRQNLLHTQIRFVPADTLYTLVRPQTPCPPYPYKEIEVVVRRKKAGVTLAGTLTIPDGEGPFPAVVLVSGSGQQNRDEELLGHKPFAVLADYLTRNGIAVLRYDDRGVGGSKGEVESATTLDFAADAEAMFSWLRKQKRIDSRRVGIVGHSEGGMIAPIVASRCGKVSFIVMLAGPGCSGADILLQQNERILELAGVQRRLIDARIGAMRSFFGMIDTLDVGKYNDAYIALADEHSKGLTADERKQAGLRKGDAMAMAMQMGVPWMRCFIKLDNTDYLRKVRCPILAIGGDRDCQVLPCNLDSIAAATQGRAYTVLMPGLNHLMQHCQTGATSEYMAIEETMAPEVMDLISGFIHKQL